jgi:hypothetical protein
MKAGRRFPGFSLIGVWAGLAVSVQAGLIHRYGFDNGAEDAIGGVNGVASVADAWTEAPLYTADIPPGAVAGSPRLSLKTGMSFGAKKSGFTLDPVVICSASGSYSLWLKADRIDSYRTYTVAALPVTSGPLLKPKDPSTMQAVFGAERSAISALFSTGVWHHVAVAWDNPSGTGSFYLDGRLIDTTRFSPNSIAPTSVRIGGYDLTGTSSNSLLNQFEGHFYDLQFYDHALSEAEAVSLHAAPGSALPPSARLIHRYRFAGNAADSGGAIDGTATTEGVWLEEPSYAAESPPGAVEPVTALSVGAEIGSKKSGVKISRDVLGAWGTVCFRFKPRSSASGRYVLNSGVNSGMVLLQESGSNSMSVNVVQAQNSSVSLPMSGAFDDWHFFAATWSAPDGAASVYLDDAAASFVFSPTNWSPSDLILGGRDLDESSTHLSSQFDGLIYDVQIYRAPLSSTEVASLRSSSGQILLPERTWLPSSISLPGGTIMASAMATAAPYYADPSGSQNSGPAIQQAIDAVGAQGGGVVFVPPGFYRIDGTLSLGYGVTLQGAGGSLDGTVLLATAGRGDTNAAPFISASLTEVGIMDLAVYYPEQTPDNIQPYPATIRTRGAATLRNILFCNSFFGADVPMINGSVIENVRGTVLNRGIFAPFSSEFSWMRDVEFSNRCWEQANEVFEGASMSAAAREALGTYTRQNLTGLELQRLDGLVIDGFSAADAKLPVYMQPNPEYPDNVFGFGGAVSGFPEARRETGWSPWYYGMHYANLDQVPEAAGKAYKWVAVPQPACTSVFIDVMSAPYAALGNGAADDTLTIQRALSAAGAAGGGTVYLPQGIYKVTAPLTVPDGVELRGPVGTGKVREGRGICTLASYYGHNTANPLTDPALITLGNHAGVRGFSILHPLQPYDVTAIKPYPYDIRGNGDGCWIVDMMLVNAWFGIDLEANRNDNFLVRDLWATVYYKGIDVGGGSVGGKLERLAFSGGPLAESVWYRDQNTPEAKEALLQFIKNNSIYYSFGASSNLTAWGLVGFQPDIQCRFYEQNGESTQHAEFWMSLFDVVGTFTIKAEQGSEVDWYGFFATSWGYLNWLNVDPAFQGPMRFYAKTIHQPHQTSAFTFTEPQVRFFDEVSLTTGKAASADRTASGSSPANAVDRNSRTFWEAPAGSVLEVDLGAVLNIDRFDVESVLFQDPSQIITRAELHASADGVHFVPVATNSTSGYYWMSMPVKKTPARYVRLVAQSGAVTLKVAGFNLFNTSATVRPVAGLSPVDAFTLRWASWPGHIYSVWHADSLTNGFTKIADGIEGSSATLEFMDPAAHQHKAAFYQLKVRSEE